MIKFDGALLKKRRKELGFTLDQLAKISNSSKSYIWELENNSKIEPSGQKIFLLAKALGVSMEYFYGEEVTQDNVKQAIVHLAHAVSSIIGGHEYYRICKMVYPDFNNAQKGI